MSTVPNNDVCSSAIDIVLVGPISGQTTVGATRDTPLESCGTTIESPGVWYRIRGDGSTLHATTCSSETNFDTKLSIFSGSCENLECINGNDDAPTTSEFCLSSGNTHSSVAWETRQGIDYFILVHGFGDSVGNFQLTVGAPPAPVNDECTNALTVGPFFGQTTFGATLDPAALTAQCDGDSVVTGGVWYRLEGTGAVIRAHTCSIGTEIDTRITVFEGTCGNLSCVAFNDDAQAFERGCSFNSLHSSVSWPSEAGRLYLIYVHGFDSLGNFDLLIEESALPTGQPTTSPTLFPTEQPSTILPSAMPSSLMPTSAPTLRPSGLPASSTERSNGRSVAVIAGASTGVAVAIGMILFLILRRRRQQQQQDDSNAKHFESVERSQAPTSGVPTSHRSQRPPDTDTNAQEEERAAASGSSIVVASDAVESQRSVLRGASVTVEADPNGDAVEVDVEPEPEVVGTDPGGEEALEDEDDSKGSFRA